MFSAKREAATSGDNQTAVHYAANNDACDSLKVLIEAGCEYKYVQDYKGRTPLRAAAELGNNLFTFLLNLN